MRAAPTPVRGVEGRIVRLLGDTVQTRTGVTEKQRSSPPNRVYDGTVADFMDPVQRSAHMAKIRSQNTKPELLLRKELHAMGYRYRLHDRKLPGTPDLVFSRRKKVVFVNGCFWHGHDCAVGVRLPKTNTEFWRNKREKNQERDRRQSLLLRELGWDFLVIWECHLKASEGLPEEVICFLGGPKA